MTYRKHVAVALLACLALIGSLSALAQNAAADPASNFALPMTHEEMYAALFTADAIQPEWLSPEMAAEVPPAMLEAIIAQYLDALGPYVGAEGMAPNFRLTFEDGYASSQLVLNQAGQIAGIWFGLPEPKVSGLDDATAGFLELPGDVSLIVVSDAGVLSAINADMPLAVGSAFKLAIAAALKDQVAAGIRSWDDVVVLESQDISIPSGILQDWPVGTPLTVQSLATLMISISDNTATDALLRLVGRETVELYAPRNKPFLSTREVFTLKAKGNEQLLAAWRDGNESEKRALLADMAERPAPDLSSFNLEPTALDVEWHFTVGELVNLIAYVHELPFMSVNPGLASASDWQHVAFKGGSEPGVLNLTTLLVSDTGTTYVVSATWNDDEQALDETRFMTLYTGLLSALAQLDG